MMSRRLFAIASLPAFVLSFAILSLAMLALAGCGGGSGGSGSDAADGVAPAATRVRLQLNWVPEPEFGGIYAAELNGYFREEGLEVEIVKGGPGVAAPQLAAAGKVEFAVVGGEQILTLREQGGDLVGLFAIFQEDPMAVMVHAESPHATLADLWRSNATLACESNLSWVRMLERRLGKGGVRIVPHTGSLAEFAADKGRAQQCFVFAEPVALELQGIPTRVFLASESGFLAYNVVVATAEAYAAAHPETCDRLVRALQRGWRSYLDDPSVTNAHMASLNTAMSREAMDLGAKRQASLVMGTDTEALGLGAMTVERWAAMRDALRELGTIGGETGADPARLFRWAAPRADS
jgi:NitT/TauT family transport system substrate-binding protein